MTLFRFTRRTAALLVPVLAIGLSACQPAGGNVSPNLNSAPGQMTVTATGEATLPPDTALVSAGVVTRADSAAEAMRDNANQMAAAFEELKSAGIAAQDIQTSQISLQPQYLYRENRERRITGYEARNTVTARTSDMKAVGPMLDALVKAGVNQINSVSFEVKDSKSARDDARIAAITEARERAKLMATAAGVKLGKIISITEGHDLSAPGNVGMRSVSYGTSSAPVSGGEQALKVTVNIVYAIRQ